MGDPISKLRIPHSGEEVAEAKAVAEKVEVVVQAAVTVKVVAAAGTKVLVVE